jgi:PAS domain S-box-containing protein
LGYLIVGALYILFSDQIVSHLSDGSEAATSITLLQTIKGWLFIAVTAAILYFLIHRQLERLQGSRQELQREKDRFQSLFQNAPVAIWVVDFSELRQELVALEQRGITDMRQYWSANTGRLRSLVHRARGIDVNLATLKLFEAADHEELGSEITRVMGDKTCEIILNILVDLRAGRHRTSWEVPIRTLGGRELTVLLSIAFLPGAGESWAEAHLLMLDVTEEKKVASQLERNRRQLNEAQRIGQTGSWEWDMVTNEVSWSDQLYKIFGIAPGQFDGTHESFLRLLQSETPDEKSAGSCLPEERNASGKKITRSDGEVRKLVSKSETLYDEDGQPVCVIGFAQDVTDRCREEEERRQLETQLRRAQKLESLGALAGGIAHDFNNILTPLYGYTELVMQELDRKSRPYEDLTHVMKAAERGKELVKQILAFSRQIEHERKPLLLHHIVNEVVKLLRATVPPNVEIVKERAPEVDAVVADPVQIHQVVMNLCVNAYHAMRKDGGELSVKISVVEVDPSQSAELVDLNAQKYVLLQVRDTGVGMSESVRQRVFEPFFTTKPSGEGTGLGLSVSRQIVHDHGGTITVKSTEGAGSEFSVYLPLAKMQTTDPLTERSEPARGNGKILFVDNEQEIAELAEEMLTRLGYRVVIALNTDAALAKLAEDPGFDVVITDQVMPIKSGLQLAAEIRASGRTMPIILLTGDGIGLSDEIVRRNGINAFLSKPFSAFELSQSIARVLETTAAPLTLKS